MRFTALYLLVLPVMADALGFPRWKDFSFGRDRNETVTYQQNRIQYHNDPNNPIRSCDNLIIARSNSSSRTNVNSVQNGTKFEVVNTAQTAIEIAHFNNLLATKYSHEKNMLKSTGRNRLGWKSKSRNSTSRSAQASDKAMAAKAEAVALKSIHDKNVAKSEKTKNAGWQGKMPNSTLTRNRPQTHQKRAEIHSHDQAVWDSARHVVTQAKYHRYLEGPGPEYEVPVWLMTPLYRAVEAFLIGQNPDGDKRQIAETAYNKVYLEVGDKKIMEESKKNRVQPFRDFAVRFDDQEPWPEAEKPEMLVEVVEPTPIPATAEVRTETTTATEMATQTVTVQKLQTVTICLTETFTVRKTQSIVKCKTKTVTKETQTTTVEAPQTITSQPAPNTTLYFHRGPGNIAPVNEPAISSHKINDVSASTDKYDFAPYVLYKAEEEKNQPTPTAAPRLQNHPGKIANGTTPEIPPPANSTEEETKSEQSPNFHPNDTTLQDVKTSEQTPQNERKSGADLENGKVYSLFNDIAKSLNEIASSISEKISKWTSGNN
jgi:hypothetical protein